MQLFRLVRLITLLNNRKSTSTGASLSAAHAQDLLLYLHKVYSFGKVNNRSRTGAEVSHFGLTSYEYLLMPLSTLSLQTLFSIICCIVQNSGGGNFGEFGETNVICQYFTQPNPDPLN